MSFVDNLLVKVDAGEWTLGEGLVATLELAVGERSAEDVLRHSKLLYEDGTGIVAMAFEYLDDGPDAEAKAEIRRTLSILLFSDEQLEAMAGLDPLAAAAPSAQAALSKKGVEEDCRAFFTDYDVPGGVGNCLEVRTSSVLEEFYTNPFRVFAPAAPWPSNGWTEHYYDLAIEAMEDSVLRYDTLLGVSEPMGISIVLSPLDSAFSAQAHPWVGEPPGEPSDTHRPCGVVLYSGMQSLSDGDFKQTVAHEIAHCFQHEAFWEQNAPGYTVVRWREEGLAEHLSNVVYFDNNAEWQRLGAVAFYELQTTVLDRAYTNFIFFQYMEQRLGQAGLVALIRSLPTDGDRTKQEDSLAAYPGMAELYRDFAKDLTDKRVEDTSGQLMPYQISEINRPTVRIDGTRIMMEDFEPFSVSRFLLVMEEGKQASLAFTPRGQVREAARPATAVSWSELSSELPGEECITETIVVVTSTKRNTGFELELQVEDTEAVCGIQGEWVVDNDSLSFDPMAFELEHIRGQMRIRFQDDGNASVKYDNFEYRVFQDDKLDVGGLEIKRHEEFTYTTNAEGVTSYEVDGNVIRFGEFSEKSYLNGTERVHHIKTFNPPNQIGSDIDEVSMRDPRGWGMFEGVPNFDLQSDGQVLRILNGNQVRGVLTRLDSAGP